MNTIEFQCETITPMFMGSADPQECELRPPSIKGAMRFWWRAINGNLGLDELRKREAEIFGGSGEKEAERSKVIIKLHDIKEINEVKISLTPHHKKGYC